MSPAGERNAEQRRLMRMHAAFCAGDLAALREAVENPDSIPNGPMPLAIGPCLEYAIYHSPLPFIRALLELGADPDQRGINDYTPLHMAVAERSAAVVEQLLGAGADHGLRMRIDECQSPLEMARAAGLHEIVEMLAARGLARRPRT